METTTEENDRRVIELISGVAYEEAMFHWATWKAPTDWYRRYVSWRKSDDPGALYHSIKLNKCPDSRERIEEALKAEGFDPATDHREWQLAKHVWKNAFRETIIDCLEVSINERVEQYA